MKFRAGRGFTLIELLVVIAVIALLISLLLPALGKMRLVARKAISLSNIRQICISANAYATDNKGWYPILLAHNNSLPGYTNNRGHLPDRRPDTNAETLADGWATWTFGGKNTNGYWTPAYTDWEAVDRPLNPYLMDNIAGPGPGQVMAANAPDRNTLQIPVFHDPSDKIGHQRGWDTGSFDPATGAPLNNNHPNIPANARSLISCYDDVGTSYQYNAKWHEQLTTGPGALYPGGSASNPNFTRAFRLGIRRIRTADTFSPSLFAWVHDEYADITVYSNNASSQIKNGYGDFNKSVMGFMDAHARYTLIRPGRTTESYRNSDYTFIFDDLRSPGL